MSAMDTQHDDGEWVTQERKKSKKQKQALPQNSVTTDDSKSKSKNKKSNAGRHPPEIHARNSISGKDVTRDPSSASNSGSRNPARSSTDPQKSQNSRGSTRSGTNPPSRKTSTAQRPDASQKTTNSSHAGGNGSHRKPSNSSSQNFKTPIADSTSRGSMLPPKSFWGQNSPSVVKTVPETNSSNGSQIVVNHKTTPDTVTDLPQGSSWAARTATTSSPEPKPSASWASVTQTALATDEEVKPSEELTSKPESPSHLKDEKVEGVCPLDNKIASENHDSLADEVDSGLAQTSPESSTVDTAEHAFDGKQNFEESGTSSPILVENYVVVSKNNNLVTEAEVKSCEPVDIKTFESNSEKSNHIDDDSRTAPEPSLSQSKLKLPNKLEELSPSKLEGRRQYDREFLLNLQSAPLSLEKPLNLPNLDIVRDKSIQSNNNNSKIPDWKPGFIKPVSTRGSLSKKASRDGSKRSNATPVKIVDVKLEEVVLHSAENAWTPLALKEKHKEDIDLSPMDILTRKVRSILNKLCPQNFDVLVKKFHQIEIDTKEKLQLCMELIFEKALDEPGFSVAYARMCEVLQMKQVMCEVEVQDENGVRKQKQPVNFRIILLNRCQKEFMRDYMEGIDSKKFEADKAAAVAAGDEAKLAEVNAEWEEIERNARRRSLGNIQFIGELYKLKMLSGRIMHQCLQKLLCSKHEESLESLCRLLTTVGKSLEAETEEKFKSCPLEKCRAEGYVAIDSYFEEIQKLAEARDVLSSRVRFMLKDVIDLRKDNWKPRRDVAGPKTIDQIHKEAEAEQIKQQLLNHHVTPTRQSRGGDGRKRSSRAGMNQGYPNDSEGVRFSGSRGSQREEQIDANKFAKFAQNQGRGFDVDQIQLGPGSRGHWSQGSTSLRLSRTREEQTMDISNKFAMLSDSQPDSGNNSRESSVSRSSDFRRPRPSRSIGVPAMDSERKKAIEAVKQTFTHNGPHGSETTPAPVGPSASLGQTNVSRPVPDSLLQTNKVVEQTLRLRGNPNLSSTDVEKYSQLLVDEYLHDENDKEAIETVCTFFHATTMTAFVECVINSVLERSDLARQHIAHLLSQLVRKNLLLQKQYQTGLNSVLELASILIVDIPKFWDYVAQLLAPMLRSNSVSLTVLTENPISNDSNFMAKYLAAVLSELVRLDGQDKVAELWCSSGLSWEQMFPQDFELANFLKSNELEFLLNMRAGITPENFYNKMNDEIDNGNDATAIIKWMKEYVGDKVTEAPYIRSLVTSVIEHVIEKQAGSDTEYDVNGAKLEMLKPVLIVVIDSHEERELQAIFALQYLMHKLEHPNQLLHKLFNQLLDEEIISEDALWAWKRCDDPKEVEGKGVAISSTNQFFIWLAASEEEE